MEEKKQHLWDTFKEKPASGIQPSSEQLDIPKMGNLIDTEVELYRHHDINQYYQYKKGTVHKVIGDDDYTQVLYRTIKLIFQCVRDQVDREVESIDEKQELQIRISKTEAAMLSLVEILKSFDFSVDNNSVIAIMHGYIHESVRILFTEYETRQNTKH
jgi:hypothetical protein